MRVPISRRVSSVDRLKDQKLDRCQVVCESDLMLVCSVISWRKAYKLIVPVDLVDFWPTVAYRWPSVPNQHSETRKGSTGSFGSKLSARFVRS